MSRYRQIYCLIWNDDKFPFVSDDCQLLFVHLLTTPFSTPFGLYKASLEALAAEKRWPLPRYKKAFREAFQKGFAKYDDRHQVVYLPQFLKHNKPNNPNVLKAWWSIYEEIPPSPLKDEFFQSIKALVEGFGKAFQEAFAEAWRKPTRKQEQEQEQEQEQDIFFSGENKKKKDPPKKDDPEPKVQYREYVRLTEKEYERLVDKHGKVFAEKCLDKLDNAKGSKGYTYKSDYRAILNWVVDELRNKELGKNGKGTGSPGTAKAAQKGSRFTRDDGREFPTDVQ
jgi:hypothetical protein